MQQESQRFQQKTQANIRNLETQVSQLASSMNNFENNKGKLLVQVIPNPKKSASVVTLCSGKEIQFLILQVRKINEEKVNEEFEKKEPLTEKVSHKCDASKTFEIDLPFPGRMAKTKKKETEKEILDTFRKVEINIPLLDVIKQ